MDRNAQGAVPYQKPELEVIDLADQIVTVASDCPADSTCTTNNCTTAFDDNVCWTEWQP